MHTEMLNPQTKIPMKQNLRSHLEKQLSKEKFFTEHVECILSMPPLMKRKALARSKRRCYLIQSLMELM
jgi:hypothetical protein